MDCIETLCVVTVYSNIFGKKFGMILGLDANIATIEQCKRLRSQFSRTDLIEDSEEWILSLAILYIEYADREP